jgi:hypothetical protein
MPILDTEAFVPGLGDGLPGHFTLPGSGLAVPAGLEATLEYNSLFLNVQANVDRYRITSIDGLYDADIRDTRDVLSDADGECFYTAFYGGRTIVLNGTIQTYSVSKMRDMQMALRAAFADIRNEYPLIFHLSDVAKDHFIKCKKVASISGTEQQTNLLATRDFQVSLRASNPRFLSWQQNVIDQNFTAGMVTTPILIGNAHNRGNYYAQPTYRVYGKCTRVTIINGATNKRFSMQHIEAGDYLEFNLSSPSPTLKDSHGANAWMWLTDDSDYVELQGSQITNVVTPSGGDNPIYYSGDATRVTISWHDSWI